MNLGRLLFNIIMDYLYNEALVEDLKATRSNLFFVKQKKVPMSR